MGLNQDKEKDTKKNSEAPWLLLKKDELSKIYECLMNFTNKNNNIFSYNRFLSHTFNILSSTLSKSLIPFLNSYYLHKKSSRVLSPSAIIEKKDVLVIGNIIMKSTLDSEDEIFYQKKIFFILYDMLSGNIEASTKDKEKLNIDKIINIFCYALEIYFEMYGNDKESFGKDNFDEDFKKEMKEFIVNSVNEDNPSSENITYDALDYFFESKLTALNGFILTYIKKCFFNERKNIDIKENNNDNKQNFKKQSSNVINENNNNNSIPLFTEPPTTLPISKFFFYIMSNANILNKPYAFKLYDCKSNGSNLSDLVYSFLGFDGPILILVKNCDKKTNEMITLGMYLNSNIKECFSNYCGDDLCHIVTIGKSINIYYTNGSDKEHYCYVSSKNQKFQSHVPGVGMGMIRGEMRFWLDANDLFNKSTFSQYDDVYSEGTPFSSPIQKLDIINIEVFGFGDLDTIESLAKKQKRDIAIISKLKSVDKSAFANSDFDREMFFGKTFAHRNMVDDRALGKNEGEKKEEK